MKVTTIPGTVENGQIKLSGNVRLPENTEVYVVVPGLKAAPPARIGTPRLVRPEQAADFQMEVMRGSRPQRR